METPSTSPFTQAAGEAQPRYHSCNYSLAQGVMFCPQSRAGEAGCVADFISIPRGTNSLTGGTGCYVSLQHSDRERGQFCPLYPALVKSNLPADDKRYEHGGADQRAVLRPAAQLRHRLDRQQLGLLVSAVRSVLMVLFLCAT